VAHDQFEVAVDPRAVGFVFEAQSTRGECAAVGDRADQRLASSGNTA
jgi:hypothetical protein